MSAFILAKPVALVGMMGAGKSAIGQALAQWLSVPFLDSDSLIVEREGKPIAKIFDENGETYFRQIERETISELLSGAPCILSTGGGAYLSDETKELMAQNGVVVWLKADLDLLWERVRHKTTRPLLLTDDPYNTLKSIFEARVRHYEKAELCVEATPDLTIQAMRDKVIMELKRVKIIQESGDA